MRRRILKALYHFTVYAVGISVLLAAISVTIIRLLLPDIGMYRGEIEGWVSRYMGYPVAVRSLDASWEGWIPQLYLRDIDLLNRDGDKVLTHFNSARISIAPVATLLQRQFVPRHLLVSGFDLTVMRRQDGSIKIQGIPLEKRSGQPSERNEIAEWLFRQSRIEIQNGKIEWVDTQHQQAPIPLKEVHLLLRTDRNRIQIEGSAALPRIYGERMDFAFDARGDLMTSNWSGELYLQGKNINPDNWYRQYRPFGFNVAGGTADIRVWSDWKKARLDGIQGELKYNEFAASVGKQSLRIDKLDYEFLGERSTGDDWRFGINVNDLVTEHGAWPETRLSITAEPISGSDQYNYSAHFGYLKLEDLAPLLSNLSFLPEKTRDAIEQLRLHGNLVDGEIHYRPTALPARQFQYDIRFEQFATEPGDGLPRIESLSGRAQGTLTDGRFLFNGDTAKLKLPGEGVDIIPINALDGSLEWHRSKDSIRLHTRLLTLANRDLNARLSGDVVLEKDASPYFDIVAELGQIDLETFTGYIPYTPRFKMRNWMEKAVLGGNLTSAEALIRGRLADFPYRDRSGQFKVIANIDRGVMEYSDKWPVVDKINTEVTVEEMKVSARFNHGQVYGAVFDSGRLTIPDVFRKQKHIFVEGPVHGEIDDLKTFIAQSPLNEDISLRQARKALSGGRFDLNLDMQIPFKIPDARPDISGSIRLAEVDLKSELGNIELNKLAGRIDFGNGKVRGSGVTASYYGKPVTLGIDGGKDGEESNTAITLQGKADNAFIADQVKRYLPKLPLKRQLILDRLSGETAWTATINYHKPADADELQRSLILESSLRGMQVDLPIPLNKPADADKTLWISRRLEGSDSPLIEFRYGDDLEAEFMLSASGNESLRGAEIHFGKETELAAAKGIMINGRIESLSLDEWWELLHESGQGTGSGMLLETNLEIGNLSLLSQHFSDVGLVLRNTGAEWTLSIDSDAVAGQVVLPVPLDRDSLATVDLDRLHLEKIDSDRHSQLDPHSLPALQTDIGDFSYDGKDLGAMSLSASPSQEGMSFNTITFTKPGMTIHGEGNWASDPHGDKSSFSIEVYADKIEKMLKTFGYDVNTIEGGETNLLINADWRGTPMEFALERLNGSISMQIKDGQLLNVEPSAGRLFGLLSIQALPRRLTLDFRDLFAKGMAFDKIEGNFDVTNGNAYTNDLFMRGPAADVAVSGRTGLSEKDYDQRVTVTPQITESLPVAGAIFGPVGIGVGAIFYLAGEMFESLRSNIDSLLRYQYTITGSWEDPVVEKVNPSREASG